MTQEKVIDDKPTTQTDTTPQQEKPAPKKSTSPIFEWLDDVNKQVRGETSLWVAVITQAMMDALSNAKTSEARYHKHEAINWLTGNSRNFNTVCHFANLDPDYVRRKAKRAIVSPQNWRAEPGTGKRFYERQAYRKRQKALKSQQEESGPAALPSVINGPWHPAKTSLLVTR